MNKNNSDIPFSVIMPVYEGDVPSHFSDAIESVNTQTLKANEVIIIKDGPLSSELNSVLNVWKDRMPELNVLALPMNVGLSSALNGKERHWLQSSARVSRHKKSLCPSITSSTGK